MLRVLTCHGRSVALAGLVACAGITACSGGGGSSPQASPGPPLGGIGSVVAFDQHVNFTVIVPPVATLNAVAAARRKVRGATTTANPYVSPKTASVSLQDDLVNGTAPRTLPASVVINITCTGTGGCSVPIQNVPAAAGVNRFSVTTFSGPGGTGNVISTGFIDVTAPSAQATSFGGTALTIGGIVQSISLVVIQPTPGFTWNIPSSGTVDVNALDPAGAIIIGSDLLASPIVVSLPQADEGTLSFSAQPNPVQATLQQPAQAVTLAYSGKNILSGTVSAQTADQTVATSVPVPISLPSQPTPPPPPPQKPPLSLYVYDFTSDRVIEYANVNAVEGGQPFGAPRRIFEVAAPNPAISCPLVNGVSPAIFNMDVGAASGTVYLQTQCNDTATGTQNYVFEYSPSVQEVVPPIGLPTPPPPTSTFSVVPPALTGSGIKVDEAHGNVYLQYQGAQFTASSIIGIALANPTQIVANFGANCVIEFGQTPPCNSTNFYTGTGFNFAIDANDYVYTPNAYNASGPNFQNVLPPGPAGEAFVGEPAVLVFPPNMPNPDPAPTPFSALAGFHDELGSPTVGSPLVAIEGSTLYVLTNAVSQIPAPGDLSGTNVIWPGLSSCNPLPDQLTNNCADASGHAYLAAYPNATTNLTAASAGGSNIVSPPMIMLGGDQAGRFGLGPGNNPGDILAVRDGFAFVLNPLPESGAGNPEIDVYDLNVLAPGDYVSVQPTTRLMFDPTQIQPSAIAIGPTGTGVGGQALLRRPARAHHNLRAYTQLLEQRRKALQARWRALRPISVAPP